jgi:hypothetical protein
VGVISPSALDLPNDAARIPGREDSCRDVTHYHTASPDDRAIADGDTRANNSAPSEPYVVPNDHRLRELQAATASSTVIG